MATLLMASAENGGVAGSDIVRLRPGPGGGNDKNPRRRQYWGLDGL
jgi:hypothetical protein